MTLLLALVVLARPGLAWWGGSNGEQGDEERQIGSNAKNSGAQIFGSEDGGSDFDST